MTNPFYLEGRYPDLPIDCTHEPGELCLHHADVDGAHEMFADLRKILDQPEPLKPRGLLVILGGGVSGSGKTSLANRCAREVMTSLKAAGTVVHRIDVRHAIKQHSVPAELRVRQVGPELRAQIVREQVINATEAPAADVTDPSQVLSAIYDVVRERGEYLVVLLPKVILPDELLWYLAATYPQMVLLVESGISAPDDTSDRLEITNMAEPLCLMTGMVRPGDGERLRKARLSTAPGLGIDFPDLEEDALDDFMELTRHRNIRFYQRLLAGFYKERMSETPLNLHSITFEDLREFYIRQIGQFGSQG